MSRSEEKAPDMNEDELMTLVNEYERRKAIIDCETKTADFAKKRTQAWQEITEAVNACSTFKRTSAQMKIKMKNLKTKAKSRFTSAKRQSSGTGGGPPPKRLSLVEEKLVSMYQNSAAWVGVPGGQESSEIAPYVESTLDDSTANEQLLNDDLSGPPRRAATTVPPTRKGTEVSVKDIRQLQFRALETQIRANEAVIATCENINNILIPNLVAKIGINPNFLKDLCNLSE